MTDSRAPVAESTVAAPSLRQSWVGYIVLGVSLIAWFVALATTGSPVGDLARWVAAVSAAVLAPGWVLVRISRRASAPLIEDLAWAVPAGCVAAMLGWFLDRVLPVAFGAYGLGPAMVIVALLVPWSRRRVLARPTKGWGVRPLLALGVVQLIAVGWMLNTGLQAWRPDPGAHGTAYFPDLLYYLDLTGELKHHLVPTYPPVSGATLSYHWFVFAITGHLTTGSGVDTFDAALRLAPASLVPAILLLVAVVARRIANRIWAGPLAAALLGAVELSKATSWSTADSSLNVLPRAWLGNPPQNLGWLAGLAAAGTVIAALRRAPEDRAVPVVLLVPFLLLAAGAKSTELVVIGAGIGAAFCAQLVTRCWAGVRRCLLVGTAVGAVLLMASATLYHGSAYGLRFRWFGTVHNDVATLFPGYATRVNPLYMTGLRYSRVALLTGAVLWLLPLLPRVAGLAFQVRYRPRDPASWFCLGVTGAGLLLTLTFQHPAGSEIYPTQSAYPIGVAGAAAGLCFALERLRAAYGDAALRRRIAPMLAGFVMVGLLGAALIARAQPTQNPVVSWLAEHPGLSLHKAVTVRQLAWDWLRPTAILASLVALGALCAGVAKRRLPGASMAKRAPFVSVATLCILVGSGVFTMTLFFQGTADPVGGSRAFEQNYQQRVLSAGVLPTTRDAFTAGSYINAHAGADDVVATNMYCPTVISSPDRICDFRDFTASALSERRTLVGGWGYADRVVDAAWSQRTLRYNYERFWDQPLLAEEQRAITDPTTQLLDDLYRHHHVRWIFADLRQGGVATAALDQLADLRFAGPNFAVWQLDPAKLP